jgi:cell wall-associated NlpC family hydrolase
LVNPEQGLAILGAALATKHPGRAGADCSHLVHAIYEKAGFPYTYVPSGDLFVGTDEFRRVAEPQAGDLVVWLGHAGIVVNPREHTFYSALRSGLLVQEYDSPYWKRRGRTAVRV